MQRKELLDEGERGQEFGKALEKCGNRWIKVDGYKLIMHGPFGKQVMLMKNMIW